MSTLVRLYRKLLWRVSLRCPFEIICERQRHTDQSSFCGFGVGVPVVLVASYMFVHLYLVCNHHVSWLFCFFVFLSSWILLSMFILLWVIISNKLMATSPVKIQFPVLEWTKFSYKGIFLQNKRSDIWVHSSTGILYKLYIKNACHVWKDSRHTNNCSCIHSFINVVSFLEIYLTVVPCFSTRL